MSAHSSHIGGEIALSMLRLSLFATFGTLLGVLVHIVWKMATV